MQILSKTKMNPRFSKVTMKKEFPVIFYILGLVFPLLIMAGAEGLLRLSGYGTNTRPWVPVSADYPDWLTLNPQFTRPYFHRQQRIPTPHFSFFQKMKDDRSFRVFVLGESSAAGFPYDANVAFPDFLARRLQSLYPQSRIEMVNLGISAINTYTIQDILAVVLEQQPDLILIYTGHNEYYGAWGAGSTENFGRVPWLIPICRAFNRLKIIEWGHQFSRNLRSKLKSSQSESSTTLMERMVGNPSIPLNSPVYTQGLRQFEHNMARMIEMIQARGIPLLIGNLVSNLRDQPPFVSDSVQGKLPPQGSHPPRGSTGTPLYSSIDSQDSAVIDSSVQGHTIIPTSQQDRKNSLFQNKPITPDDPARREIADSEFLTGMFFFESSSALKNYHAAQAAEQSGNYGLALRLYIKARDLDALRFRAPSDFNRIIQNLAHNYSVPLVNLDSSFMAHSPHGLIGYELMTDHLHPTSEGYRLMADAFLEAMRKNCFLPSTQSDTLSLVPETPFTSLDSVIAQFRIATLKSSWPFTDSLQTSSGTFRLNVNTFIDSLGFKVVAQAYSFEKAHLDAADRYLEQGKYQDFCREINVLIAYTPFNSSPYRYAIQNLLQNQQFALAIPFLRRQANGTAPDAFTYKWLGISLMANQEFAESIQYLDKARNLTPLDAQLLYNLAGAYLFTGQMPAALHCLQACLQVDSTFPGARLMADEVKRKLK